MKSNLHHYTILNTLYNKMQFWDGRAKTLEDQAACQVHRVRVPTEKGEPVIASHKLYSRSGVINRRFAIMTFYADLGWKTRKSWAQVCFSKL
jgi:cytochrome c peroxidase